MRDAAILTGRGAIPLLLEALTASLSSVSPRNRGPDAAQSTKDTGASSSAAHDMLLEQAEALIDMRAPLVWQIQKLSKAQYLAWVHSPFHYTSEPKFSRLFHSDLIEPLSKTVWYAVPATWLPVAALLWCGALLSPTLSLLEASWLLAGGLFIWTLVEYLLHRFVFHLDEALPDNGAALSLHFLIHGIHHRVPMDRYRLVMPPIMASVWAAILYGMFLAVIPLPWQQYNAMFASGLLGYVCYDMMHYAQHHSSAHPESYVGRMKRYHMKHHFNGQQNLAFGITSKFWDGVFGTTLPDPHRAVIATAKNL